MTTHGIIRQFKIIEKKCIFIKNSTSRVVKLVFVKHGNKRNSK